MTPSYTTQELEFIKIFYSEYGSVWVGHQLSMEPSRIRHIAKKHNLYKHYKPTYKEIASTLNISEKEVYNSLQSAFRKIKTIITNTNKELINEHSY